MNKLIIATIALSMATGVAYAENTTSGTFLKDVGVSVKGGTAGFGVDVTKAINDNFKVRLGYSTYTYNTDHSEEDVDYDAKLRLGGLSVLGDYHPWAGGFRVTAGAYAPKYRVTGNAKYNGSGTITINNQTYTSADLANVNLEAKWNGVRPYLGLGYDGFNKTTSGLFFTADVGVIFSGSPNVRLNATCTNAALCSQAASDIAAEENKLRNDITGAKYLPVVQLGVGYRF
jgi:hypothetical protein